ncbi:MAG: hypothetical protein KatS3mg065_0074 [Chloroflexota bacterium]|nr:MAG: hypothetical protein KatS3mg065_0074 [Chloroflexota bacterium]
MIVRRRLEKGFWNRDGGIEFPLSLLGAVVALTAGGAGAISLDAALGIALSDPIRGIVLLVALAGAAVAIVLRPAEERTGVAGNRPPGSLRPS